MLTFLVSSSKQQLEMRSPDSVVHMTLALKSSRGSGPGLLKVQALRCSTQTWLRQSLWVWGTQVKVTRDRSARYELRFTDMSGTAVGWILGFHNSGKAAESPLTCMVAAGKGFHRPLSSCIKLQWGWEWFFSGNTDPCRNWLLSYKTAASEKSCSRLNHYVYLITEPNTKWAKQTL